MDKAAKTRPNWKEAAAIYCRPRLLFVLAMGIASGLPLLLTLSTLNWRLSSVGIDKTTIGLFALVGAPYTFKFLWSPLIDQTRLPFLGRLGRRRSWLLLIQLFLAVAIFSLGQTDPAQNAPLTALAALSVAFLSASQDIVIDAYRIEILAAEEQGAGAGATQSGYRVGMLMAGAAAVAASDFLSWPSIFAALATLMLLLACVTLLAPEPKAPSAAMAQPGAALWIKHAFLDPFADFMGRRGWLAVLAFILFYKFGDAVGGNMAMPFYKELGFTGVEVGTIQKIWGILATMAGAILGGAIAARIGLFRALLLGGVLQAATNLAFSYLALAGHSLAWLIIAVTLDNLAGGMASAAFVAYMSGLCNAAFTATQYALLTSFMAYGRTLMASGSGWLADHMAWAEFWALTAFLAVPGLFLLLILGRLYPALRARASA